MLLCSAGTSEYDVADSLVTATALRVQALGACSNEICRSGLTVPVIHV